MFGCIQGLLQRLGLAGDGGRLSRQEVAKLRAELNALPADAATQPRIAAAFGTLLISWVLWRSAAAWSSNALALAVLLLVFAGAAVLAVVILGLNTMWMLRRWGLERTLRGAGPANVAAPVPAAGDANVGGGAGAGANAQAAARGGAPMGLQELARESLRAAATPAKAAQVGVRHLARPMDAYTPGGAGGGGGGGGFGSSSAAAASRVGGAATPGGGLRGTVSAVFDPLASMLNGGRAGASSSSLLSSSMTLAPTPTPARGRVRAGSGGTGAAAYALGRDAGAAFDVATGMAVQEDFAPRPARHALGALGVADSSVGAGAGAGAGAGFASPAGSMIRSRARAGSRSAVKDPLWASSFGVGTGSGWSSIRARDLGLDAHNLSGFAAPEGAALRAVEGHVDRAAEVTAAVARAGKDQREADLKADIAHQKPKGPGYRPAKSEHPPGELMPVGALPRHVHMADNTLLGGELPDLKMLASAMRRYIADHINSVFLMYLNQNTMDLIDACTSNDLPLFDPDFLNRAPAAAGRRAGGFGLTLSRFGLEGSDRARGLPAEFPVRKVTVKEHPHPVTVDQLIAEFTYRDDPQGVWKAKNRVLTWGMGIPNPAMGRRNNVRMEDRLPLWREKAMLESFLWSGPGFSTSSSVAAAGRAPGDGGGPFDVKAYVLERLRVLGSDMNKYTGDDIAYGNGLGRMSRSRDPALALLPTDAQIIWHYAVTLFDALIADAAANKSSSRMPSFRVDEANPTVLDQIFREVYVDFGPLGAGGGGAGGAGKGDAFLGSPTPGFASPPAVNHSSLAPVLQQSVRFKLHCVDEIPAMELAVTVDGVPVRAAGNASTSTGADMVFRTLALFSYLQLKEAQGCMWVHRDAFVKLDGELEKMTM
jgi:hypothetical protein